MYYTSDFKFFRGVTMKVKVLGTSVILAAILFSGCASSQPAATAPNFDAITKEKTTQIQQEVKVVSGEAVAKMMSEKKNIVIVDVREADEIKTFGKVDWKNQKTMSRGKLEYMLPKAGLKLDDEIYVMCKTGGRSTFAAKTLKEYGFKNVTIVDGGFDKWLEKKLPSVD
jgi:rhodanese-related sulfurtransferase